MLEVCEQVPGADARALRESVRHHARQAWRDRPQWAECNDLGISSWEALVTEGAGPGRPDLEPWGVTFAIEVWSRALGNAALAVSIAEDYRRVRRSRYRLWRDAAAALPALRAWYRLGIVTNGPAELQDEKVRAVHLDDFEVVVISGVLGVGKPSPRPFLAALERLGASASETVMVGDSLGRDVRGANAAGLRTIWLNRWGAVPAAAEPAPAAVISDLTQLPAALDALRK